MKQVVGGDLNTAQAEYERLADEMWKAQVRLRFDSDCLLLASWLRFGCCCCWWWWWWLLLVLLLLLLLVVVIGCGWGRAAAAASAAAAHESNVDVSF